MALRMKRTSFKRNKKSYRISTCNSGLRILILIVPVPNIKPNLSKLIKIRRKSIFVSTKPYLIKIQESQNPTKIEHRRHGGGAFRMSRRYYFPVMTNQSEDLKFIITMLAPTSCVQ